MWDRAVSGAHQKSLAEVGRPDLEGAERPMLLLPVWGNMFTKDRTGHNRTKRTAKKKTVQRQAEKTEFFQYGLERKKKAAPNR